AKRYGELQAVRPLSFEVRPGEIFGFLGPNGAGKTTTLRMLMGITAPDSGEVRFEGEPRLDRSRVGYLPEERGLFEDSPVLETAVYLGELRGMSRAAARAAAVPLLERLGLADRLKEKVNTLSKGNQQKVQLVGALLHRPALAVLDEPFSGLDPLNQELFVELMRELRDRGAAVLLSAHQLDLVERLADRFLLISHGRAVLSGTLADIRRQAAGGVDDVVQLHLAPRSGHAFDVEALRATLAALLPGGRAELRDVTPASARIDLWLPSGTDLGPLLSVAAQHAQVHRVETRRLPLHEIYLQAVRATGDPLAATEVTHGA
ncbi:MAG: ATP-binding cassette domain-containing protein, partial [Candidatus Eisenbacteria bacterium]